METNEHLKQIFNTVLVGLENAGVDYWVFGGIGIAGCVGRFVRRKNKDIDIFVKEDDFDTAVLILAKIFNELGNFEFKLSGVLEKENYKRPKWEARSVGAKGDIFSIVPVFEEKSNIIMVFPEGTRSFSRKILDKVERKVLGYRFFTPPIDVIQEIFLYCLSKRKDWQNRESKRIDGRAILSSGDFKKVFTP